MAAKLKPAKESKLPPSGELDLDWMWHAGDAPRPLPDDARMPPKISVITPSYNQGRFIERTIRSVLLQDYPSLEYIVIDGGSTDNTVEILRRYDSFLTYWSSEPDHGQSHAINKGFSRATGEVLCWLNSDDFYLPGTLAVAGRMLAAGTGNFAITGHCLRVHEDGSPPLLLEGKFEDRRRLLAFWKGYQMHQPAIFWRREVFEKVGWLNEDLHLIMDFDYWARISEFFGFVTVNRILACCSYHAEAKTGDDYQAYHRDLRRYAYKYWGSRLSLPFWSLLASRLRHSTREVHGKLKRKIRTSLTSPGS